MIMTAKPVTPAAGAKKTTRKLEGIFSGSELRDIKITLPEQAGLPARALHMLGPGGPERELAFLPPFFHAAPTGQPAPQNIVPQNIVLEQYVPEQPAPENLAPEQPTSQAPRQAQGQAQGQTHGQPASFDPQQHLPVLLGSGLGFALERLINALRQTQGENFRLIVVDKEEDILQLSALRERYSALPGLYWVTEKDSDLATDQLVRLQMDAGGKGFYPIVNPFYSRLDRPYYSALRDALESSMRAGFWEKAAYRKFTGAKPRILLITSRYFLIGEVQAACERLGFPCRLIQIDTDEYGHTEFVEELLAAVIAFQPDFVLTINHLGVDREGILLNLLARLRLPLASWFVDNPHLVLHLYNSVVSPWTAIFTWDEDNIPSLRAMGFEEVSYLPLGVDHTRFVPAAENPHFAPRPEWRSQVSFVGNSMLHKVDKRLEKTPLPPEMKGDYQRMAAEFGASPNRSVRGWLQESYPAWFAHLNERMNTEEQLAFETALTWEATLQYRLGCVRAILPFNPLIVGDNGWLQLLADVKTPWVYHSELSYYTDLPGFYPLSDINFNCTSKQMKGAVNQRVFDVPAAGAFVLTDWRDQLAGLFEPGKEVVAYHSPEEAEDLARYYLAHSEAREKIIRAARARVLRDHSYDQRLKAIAARMRKVWG